MIITDEQFRQLCNFVQQYLKETATNSKQEWLKDFPRAAEHRWQHTLNVLGNAERILAGEGTDSDTANVVRGAVILHDIAMFTCDHTVHGQVGADFAQQYLLDQGYHEEFVLRVARAIAEHGTDFGDLPPEEQGTVFSWAGKVLVEADILDKLGANPILESLLYLGKQGHLPHECRMALTEGRAMQRATFFKDYFWTKTGKQMAEERFKFFHKFLEQVAQEVYESSNPFEVR